MKQTFDLHINQELKRVSVEPWGTLADLLRNEFELTGVKISCNSGSCGACTVLVNNKVVKSCLMLAVQAKGKNITTIEGLASGKKLHPLQEAFINHGAVQCGFCTPGTLMVARSFLDREPNPTEKAVREAISGNICRCTGYAKIVDAIMDAAGKAKA